jgi:hypothetical protein
MMSIVVDDLRRRFGPDAKIAWIRLERSWSWQDDPDMTTETQSLRSVVTALAPLLCDNGAAAARERHESFDDIVRLTRERLGDRATETMDDLTDILRLLGAPTSRVFLLFDDVDHARSDVQATLMPQLQDLQASLGLNIFATALFGNGNDRSLFPCSISLEIRASAEDITAYLHHGLDADPRLRRLVGGVENDDLRREIVQRTVDLSDGMSMGPFHSSSVNPS